MKADVSGLPPARAALVRYFAWRERERAELTRLIGAWEAFFSALGVPEVAQADLDRITAEDSTSYLSWIRAGAAKAAMFTVDAFRRSQAEAKLSEATAQAETDRAGLAGIDADIEFQQAVVCILEERQDEFVRSALVEATEPTVREFEAIAERLVDLIKKLGGAAHTLRRRTDKVHGRCPDSTSRMRGWWSKNRRCTEPAGDGRNSRKRCGLILARA